MAAKIIDRDGQQFVTHRIPKDAGPMTTLSAIEAMRELAASQGKSCGKAVKTEETDNDVLEMVLSD